MNAFKDILTDFVDQMFQVNHYMAPQLNSILVYVDEDYLGHD